MTQQSENEELRQSHHSKMLAIIINYLVRALNNRGADAERWRRAGSVSRCVDSRKHDCMLLSIATGATGPMLRATVAQVGQAEDRGEIVLVTGMSI